MPLGLMQHRLCGCWSNRLRQGTLYLGSVEMAVLWQTDTRRRSAVLTGKLGESDLLG